jgi:hypothetical protein
LWRRRRRFENGAYLAGQHLLALALAVVSFRLVERHREL